MNEFQQILVANLLHTSERDKAEQKHLLRKSEISGWFGNTALDNLYLCDLCG
jgi:hypothetical protein